MKDYLTKAIQSLRPGAEFSIIDGDYSTVKWDILKGEAPTETEIEAEIAKIKDQELKQIESNMAAKTALLERLGITADEAALLLQ